MVENKNISEEQLHEFMIKMYADLSGKIDSINKEIKENMVTKDDLARTSQSIARLEDKMDTNHKFLYDVYKQTYEKLTILENKIDEIDRKVEIQYFEIRIIRGAKQ